jgi:hypothetical protein
VFVSHPECAWRPVSIVNTMETRVQRGWWLVAGVGRSRCTPRIHETRIALGEFVKRFPQYEADRAGIERFHSTNVHGLSKVSPRRSSAPLGSCSVESVCPERLTFCPA